MRVIAFDSNAIRRAQYDAHDSAGAAAHPAVAGAGIGLNRAFTLRADNPRDIQHQISSTMGPDAMTPRQIRTGLALAAFVTVASLANLLLLQSGEGRGPRPDRAYRGLSALPGTPSTTIKEGERGAAALETGAVGKAAPRRARDAADGSQAGLVQKVQRALAARGYASGDGNGTLDIVTRAAIMAFEHDRNLTLTAEPSELLLAEIASDVPLAPSIAPGRQSDAASGVVRVVQQTLARLDYQPGAADGVAGAATAAAIRAFEGDSGMPISGRVSGLLIVRLAEAQGARPGADRPR